MKKLIFILILVWLGVLLCKAQLALNNAPFAALLSRNPATADYFLQENFEGPGYQNVWTISSAGGGVIDDTYTTAPAPLEASYSLRLNMAANSRRITNALPTEYSTIYGYMLILSTTVPASANNIAIMFLSNNVPVVGFNLFEFTANNWGGQIFDTNTSYCCVSGGAGGAENQTNHLWFSFTTGTGANGVLTLARSVNGIKPVAGTEYVTTSSSSARGTVNQFVVGTTNNSSWKLIIDKIRLSTSPIGDNPP